MLETVKSQGAYNLFYRRRDWHEANMESLDFEKLSVTPDMECLEKSKA